MNQEIKNISDGILFEINKAYKLLCLFSDKFTDKDIRSSFFELTYISLYSHYRNFYSGIDFNQFYIPFDNHIPHNRNPEHLQTIFQNCYNSSNFSLMMRVFSNFELAVNVLCEKKMNINNKNKLLNYFAQELQKELKKNKIDLPKNLYEKYRLQTFSKVPFPRKLNVLLKQLGEEGLEIKRKEVVDFFECFMHYRNSIHYNFIYKGKANKIYKINYNSRVIEFNFNKDKLVDMHNSDGWLSIVYMTGKALDYANIIFESIQGGTIYDPSYEVFRFR